ncbi:hypothetical protein ACFOSD_12505 [Salinispirillum marinum]|uniref:VanZ-like domain-containing protein n=2 Tax=Saccharospirillaceae TaxID=255527 RepID=A0ABV8BJC2_9GAMM
MMNRFSFLIFLTVTTGFLCVLYRDDYEGGFKFVEIFIYSYPSFAYMLGILSLLRIFHLPNSNRFKQKFIIPVFAGSVLYEVQQYWGAGVFDVNDVFGLVIGLVFFMAIDYKSLEKHKVMTSV